MTNKQNKNPQVLVKFEGELAQRFKTVKKFYGIKQNTDLIRLLITLKYEEITKRRD